MRRHALVIPMTLPALTACTPSPCEVDGVAYRVGESWTCADGCNSCTCTEDGVSQTDMCCITDSDAVDDTDGASASAK
ncbi:MAG: Beta-microseminoprotein [Pseudomonadota bacterium]